MEEPIGHVLKRTELADGLILEKTSCPLGVLLIVFESRPDALVQIASFGHPDLKWASSERRKGS
ncbi:Delta-1-pyrroline-5-carboxylate synthase [Ancistrocladus abbreviatus]